MSHESFTVYVIDDDVSIQKALKRVLRMKGYYALTFDSAEDFIDHHILAPGEGIIVLDIGLPGISGLELQEKLASLGAKYPIIFMTVHDDPEWRQRAKNAGAVAYLKKPFHQQSLLDAIRFASGSKREEGRGDKELQKYDL